MLSFYATTHAGGRPCNEDRVAVFQDGDRWCCVLADGLGGMGGGGDAAQCVADTLRACFESGQMRESTLQESCRRAHQAICALREQKGRLGSMFSTVILLYGTENRIFWTHCGDSRLYLFCDETICFRTKDHSVPQMLASCGEISEADIRMHPDRNRLLSSLGAEDAEPKLSPVGSMELRKGLSALLCSDGFWEPVSEEEMVETLHEAESVAQWVEGMADGIGNAPPSAGTDNYSAIGVWIR